MLYGQSLLHGVLSFVGCIAVVYVAVCCWMFLMQDRIMYQPRRNILQTPKDIGIDFEVLKLKTTDQILLAAWHIPVRGARGTVLFCHGNGGNMSDCLEYANLFHRLRLNTLLFDYRGYGESEGRPSEKGTYTDANTAWSHLIHTRKVEPRQIVLYGHSLGGAVACDLASRVAPAGLIMEAAFTSLPDSGAAIYPWLPVRLLSRFRYDNMTKVKAVSCAKLFIHSPEDEVVPFRLGKALFDEAPPPKEFLQTDGGHNSVALATNERFREQLDSFLRKVLS